MTVLTGGRQIEVELAGAERGWAEGNAGLARVGSRRAAGMALAGWLAVAPRAGYGTNFMHHLRAMADDTEIDPPLREAAWRLAARPVPEGGWIVPPPHPLTPMMDARTIIDWCAARLAQPPA